MVVLEVVAKLEQLNEEQKNTLDQLHEQFEDLAKDPRFAGLPMDEIENLFSAYLKTWIKTNNDVINLLKN
ncbi:hypothetical protein C5F47_04280 [Nitrosopumilus cobalaminigenes]|uniref:Uncharacterized protein n=1 Tax=Nitrosopumilus cobalaminigenes TaxID=1470066 RepID=A0A7D5R5S8_9ARCH|nr:hypothetical protein [Nitrosopumilus cobalaminigenes]QLH02824.1 hypothetical protein C5F47_04280 [Nitrosopumilus cobalaminigenes]